MLTTLASYQFIAGNMQASLNRLAEQPPVAREIEYYMANIKDIDTIDQFLADDRIYRFAMKAMGLGDMIYAKAFMRKVLEEGISNPESFANTLVDKRYREFARTFNFDTFGATATTFERARQGTVDAYLRQQLEEDAGQDNEGVRLALYFERKASGLNTAYDILADPALLKVAEVALGLTLTRGDIDKNAKAIEKRLDLADLKDTQKLDKFLQRFTTMWELQQPSSPQASAPGILFAQPLEAGIGQDLLQSLQQLKLTGR